MNSYPFLDSCPILLFYAAITLVALMMSEASSIGTTHLCVGFLKVGQQPLLDLQGQWEADGFAAPSK